MKLYVVQNQEGKFFRNKGYGGYGETWREKLEDAKFYSKIGQAKSRVTFFYKTWPEYGCPKILEFDLGVAQAKVIDMEKLTSKSILKIQEKELRRKLKHLNYQLENRLENKKRTEQEIEKIQQQLEKFKK